MENSSLRCPTCGSASLVPGSGGVLICSRCGGVCEVTGQVCPQCGATNPAEAERCQDCGRLLDLVGFVLRTRLLSPAERLEQTRYQAAAFRKETEMASQERLRQWWEQEAERRREMAQAQLERDRQERTLLAGALIFAVIVVIALLVYVLVTGSGGPGTPVVTPTPLQ